MRSLQLEAILKSATDDALEGHYIQVSVELVLLVLLRGDVGMKFRKQQLFVAKIEEQLRRAQSARATSNLKETTYSRELQEILSMATRYAETSYSSTATVTHFLVAVLSHSDLVSGSILKANGVQYRHILAARDDFSSLFSDDEEDEDTKEDPQSFYFKNMELISRSGYFTNAAEESQTAPSTGEVVLTPEEQELVQKFLTNVSHDIREGKPVSLVGREKEMDSVVTTLSRKLKNTPMLVGEPGVGKTAIIYGLALRIIEEKVPDNLKDYDVYLLNTSALIAGTIYRGQFEKRLEGVLDIMKKLNRAILFIDEIHNILGLGSSGGSAMGAEEIIKPRIENDGLSIVGATTFTEYRKIVEQNSAFSRRFNRIDVLEPSKAETVTILNTVKIGLEEHHFVHYSKAAIEASVELSSKYMLTKFLPDKAIDLLDLAGARKQFLGLDTEVTRSDVEAVIAEILKLPISAVNDSDIDSLNKLKKGLHNRVFGQDAAIDQVVRAIAASRLGLTDEHKPIGSFLFSGPTGVGKTELVKQLADILNVPLLKFDMSEYKEAHTVARLIGSPPGYVGSEDGGLLTEAVTQSPHAVVLLDEIEKAHPDIFNLLLQVMDAGRLTDSQGRVVDFHHVVLILTTNAGSADADSAKVVGFAEQKANNDIENTAVEMLFTPEFRNRLSAHITFTHITPNILSKIVKKFIKQLNLQLVKYESKLILSVGALDFLLKKGYDKKMGARPMERTVQKYIKDVLVDAILSGTLSRGKILVKVKDDKLILITGE